MYDVYKHIYPLEITETVLPYLDKQQGDQKLTEQ